MKTLLHPNEVFHVYNHAVGSDNLFRSSDDYLRFLSVLPFHTRFFCDLHAYCLMPNHVHLLLQICSKEEILHRLILEEHIRFHKTEKIRLMDDANFSRFLSTCLGRAFSSHAQHINKAYMRMGNLFVSNFKRKAISDDEYYRNVVRYIHLNPVNHGFVQGATDWAYSSYHQYRFMDDRYKKNCSLFNVFGGFQNFVLAHEDANPSTIFVPDFNPKSVLPKSSDNPENTV